MGLGFCPACNYSIYSHTKEQDEECKAQVELKNAIENKTVKEKSEN